MRQAASWLAAIGSAAVIFVSAMIAPRPATSQTAGTLAGTVSSAEEGMMEGVLVSVRKDGSTITTTVVSDNEGRYSFPAGRLDVGHYGLSIRAVGYDLAGPKSVDIEAGKAAAADVKVVKTKNLAAQLSNAEWIASAPGTDRQRALLTNCVGCHTVQRVFMSTHDSAEFMTLLPRMAGYSPGTTPLKPQRWVGPSPRGFGPRQQEAADYFATINLSAGDSWEYRFKTLPRPKGRATHVIVTEYDLPRNVAMPHDVVLDQDGMPWYSDFGSLFIGQYRQGHRLRAAAIAAESADRDVADRFRSGRQPLGIDDAAGRRRPFQPQGKEVRRVPGAEGLAVRPYPRIDDRALFGEYRRHRLHQQSGPA
jgi:hypothetical protein